MSDHKDEIPVLTLKPPTGWQLVDFKELIAYRDLFYLLVMRNLKVMYAQTILGVAWGIIQPLMNIIVFSIIFGKVAKVSSEGVPYALFSAVAIIPWTYMSTALTQSSQSLVTNQGMLGKIYFPRLIFPWISVIASLGNFLISIMLLIAIMFYYHVAPTWNLLYLPVFILMMISVPAGAGMWLSALSIRYRDVKFAMQYIIQLLMYSAPIVYSASTIPEQYRIIYSLNPIVGVVEGFRAMFLGTEMNWQYMVPGMITSMLILLGGALYFRRMEKVFVDVV
jgi:lipopolysaccharide transport system permease protein